MYLVIYVCTLNPDEFFSQVYDLPLSYGNNC